LPPADHPCKSRRTCAGVVERRCVGVGRPPKVAPSGQSHTSALSSWGETRGGGGVFFFIFSFFFFVFVFCGWGCFGAPCPCPAPAWHWDQAICSVRAASPAGPAFEPAFFARQPLRARLQERRQHRIALGASHPIAVVIPLSATICGGISVRIDERGHLARTAPPAATLPAPISVIESWPSPEGLPPVCLEVDDDERGLPPDRSASGSTSAKTQLPCADGRDGTEQRMVAHAGFRNCRCSRSRAGNTDRDDCHMGTVEDRLRRLAACARGPPPPGCTDCVFSVVAGCQRRC